MIAALRGLMPIFPAQLREHFVSVLQMKCTCEQVSTSIIILVALSNGICGKIHSSVAIFTGCFLLAMTLLSLCAIRGCAGQQTVEKAGIWILWMMILLIIAS